MVNFFKTLLRYYRFKRAEKKCDKLRYKGINCYVFNYNGKPILLNRLEYNKLRGKGFLKDNCVWDIFINKAIYPKH